MPNPISTFLEDEHIHVWGDLDVQLTFERFREEGGDLKADVQPQSVAGNGYLPPEKLNLSSGRSIKMYANTLGGRGLLDADTWFECLTTASRLSRERYRTGAPSQRLSEVEWQGRPAFSLAPLWESQGTTIWFGDGGVSKSAHALAGALSIATGLEVIPGCTPLIRGPVLYLDWEANAEIHAQRLAALCAALGIEVPDNIHYMYRTVSLSESIREVRRVVALEEIVAAVVDSVGAAGGGDPERADTLIRAMNGIRALEIPTLAIHHVTKDQKDKSKPFGSVYAPNLARLTWRLDKEQDEGSDTVRVRWTNFKGNNVELIPSRGHGIRFTNDGAGWDRQLSTIEFVQVSGAELPATTRNTLKWQIAELLKTSGALTVTDIADALGVKENGVRAQLSRHKEYFVRTGDAWGLLDQHTGGSVEKERITSKSDARSSDARSAAEGSPIGGPDAPFMLQKIPTEKQQVWWDDNDEDDRINSLAGI